MLLVAAITTCMGTYITKNQVQKIKSLRMNERKRAGVQSRDGFTVFIENLPCNLDKFGLKGIFQRVGAVSDSYIPAKLGSSRKRFGFIRFWKETDAVNSVLRLNGVLIRGCRIRVCRARYGKGSIRSNEKGISKLNLKMVSRKRWREKRSRANQGMENQKDQEVVATLAGETNECFVEWLSRSIICTSSVSWDLGDIAQALEKAGCSKVRALTNCKYILTYQSSEQRDEALKNQASLAHWFHEVKNWDIYEACDSRRLWIEVFGVPPHGWSLQNFEIIASLRGKLVCLEHLSRTHYHWNQ